MRDDDREKAWGPFVPVALFFVVSCSVLWLFQSTRNRAAGGIRQAKGPLDGEALGPGLSERLSPAQRAEASASVSDDAPEGYVRPNKIFGLLHYAKTAGTEINGILAARFERVCGNKAYSYDAYQFNKRVANVTKASNESSIHVRNKDLQDLVRLGYKGHNRGRVPFEVMREIGFEDCDYISLEQNYWQAWLRVARSFAPVPFELHLPCRDPLEHLMSQCNFNRVTFRCGGAASKNMLLSQIGRCMLFPTRFGKQLATAKELDLKCFDSDQIETYVDYMSQALQTKRFPVDYVHRRSNRPRNKATECIWQDKEVAETARKILLTRYDYYSWCSQCLGSDRDLLVNT